MTQIFDSLHMGLEKVVEMASKNIKAILGALVALLVLGGIWTGLNVSKNSKEKAGFSALSPFERDYNNWKVAQNPNPEATEKPPVVDQEKLFNDLTQLVKSKPDLKATQLASLMLADLGFTLGKEKEVLETLSSVKASTSDDLLSSIAMIKKGDLQANQNQCDQALATWSTILKSKKNVFLKDLVHLKSGLCEEKLAQKEKALAHYDSVINMKDLKADRWAYKEAQKYKRALSWSQN